MSFLIVLGALILTVCLLIRKKLEWNVSEYENCPQATQDVENNHKAWKVMLIIGIVTLIIGIIGVIL